MITLINEVLCVIMLIVTTAGFLWCFMDSLNAISYVLAHSIEDNSATWQTLKTAFMASYPLPTPYTFFSILSPNSFTNF